MIQMGSVIMKFEPGVKRPKLTAQEAPAVPRAETGQLRTEALTGALFYQAQTFKLPQAVSRLSGKVSKTKDDSEFLKGQSAISYEDLAKPEVKQKSKLGLIIAIGVAVVVLGGGAYYYFMVMHGAPAPGH